MDQEELETIWNTQLSDQMSLLTTCNTDLEYFDYQSGTCMLSCPVGLTYEKSTRRCRGPGAFDMYDLFDEIAVTNPIIRDRANDYLAGSLTSNLVCREISNIQTPYSTFQFYTLTLKFVEFKTRVNPSSTVTSRFRLFVTQEVFD